MAAEIKTFVHFCLHHPLEFSLSYFLLNEYLGTHEKNTQIYGTTKTLEHCSQTEQKEVEETSKIGTISKDVYFGYIKNGSNYERSPTSARVVFGVCKL